MKRNTLFSFLTIATLGLLTAAQANATDDTYTWVGGAGTGSQQTQWDYRDDDDYANWNWDAAVGPPVTELPISGDTVVIPNVDHDPEISTDVTFTTLTIKRNGELTVTGANTLTLTGSSHTLNGNLVLQDNDSIVKFTGGTVTASGTSTTGIKGEDNGAKLQIDDSTLTSNALIQGHMIIMESSGDSTFVNGSTGIVRANGNPNTSGSPEILKIASGLTFDDVSGAKYQAKTDSEAVLQFDVGASCIKGDFLIDNCATIKLADNVTIKTEGGLTHTAGRLTIGSSATFAYGCNSGCSSCTTTVTTSQCVGSCNCP